MGWMRVEWVPSDVCAVDTPKCTTSAVMSQTRRLRQPAHTYRALRGNCDLQPSLVNVLGPGVTGIGSGDENTIGSRHPSNVLRHCMAVDFTYAGA